MGGETQVGSGYCSPFCQLTANYVSSLTFSNCLSHIAYEGKGKRKRGVGEAEVEWGLHSNINRSAGDPYMTSD